LSLKTVVLAALALSLGCAGVAVKQENPLVVSTVDDALNYDTPPSVISSAKPQYSDFAREVRAEGRVLLKVLVLENGKVGAVQVLESSHPLLTENALEAVSNSVFAPAVLKGVPVQATIIMPFVFSLDPNLMRTSITEEPKPDIGSPGVNVNPPPQREEPQPRLGK
jgi:TonB family protein